ncbi:FRG domain-containing protein [Alcaligenes parafaecalis]|uniref:FRG domain-containing protein n=1 Tax=Alcaligenes parafaecalis TaxID=171260 RepID=A0ABT3VHI3_9BURK|nr:FRG domain-containing protein [Alcaligenes parafaecalis]MCX5462687.1 FRG domain-containing protein [Alcaligenes parafaecalis]
METLSITTIEELRMVEQRFVNGFLFRGQAKHYFDETGAPSFPTSFERKGCVPPLMQKWLYFARALIRAVSGAKYEDISDEFVQAILQHYGWRSFYIDLTKSLTVACWFASHQYSEKRTINMCENHEEDPVWLVHTQASYAEVTTGKGHLYVIDIAALKAREVGLHDLDEISVEGGPLRFHAQHACLAGIVSRLPSDAVVAHLTVENGVLLQRCAEAGLNNTNDLFPSAKTDFLLHALLDIPWQRVFKDEMTIPVFHRGLDLPEYRVEFTKHLPPQTILYDEFWIDEQRQVISDLTDFRFYRMQETAYYSSPPATFSLPEVTKLLNGHGAFVIELDAPIRPPERSDSYVCDKGVFVRRTGDGLVEVTALLIGHPTNVPSGGGVSAGWFYSLEGDVWKKAKHIDECPCNNDLVHERHFNLLRILNDALADGQFKTIGPLSYAHLHLFRAATGQ